VSDTVDLKRRRLLQLVALAPFAWQARPWLVSAPDAFAQTLPNDPTTVSTLEAFADTLIPGEKRSPDDPAIAGAAAGPGAVQAGALALMNFAPVGVAPALPGFATGLNAHAVQYAASHAIVLDPTVPPFVALAFADRTALLVEILDGSGPDELAFFALAALAFLAYHTAGHLPLVDAVRGGHPGLAAIGFPQPQADGVWRYTDFSYRRALSARHPQTSKRGNPP
jgi:hypothetical protein